MDLTSCLSNCILVLPKKSNKAIALLEKNANACDTVFILLYTLS